MAFVAAQVAYSAPQPIAQTPAVFGLRYENVTLYSRQDHLRLRGWYISGVLPDGRLTTERTIIMVHGLHSNRAAPLILDLSAALARRGFAILAIDLRGHGQSSPAPLSLGYFEQRDVLGVESYKVTGNVYVNRVVAFFTAALGPDTTIETLKQSR